MGGYDDYVDYASFTHHFCQGSVIDLVVDTNEVQLNESKPIQCNIEGLLILKG
jgi:hypothetical protein